MTESVQEIKTIWNGIEDRESYIRDATRRDLNSALDSVGESKNLFRFSRKGRRMILSIFNELADELRNGIHIGEHCYLYETVLRSEGNIDWFYELLNIFLRRFQSIYLVQTVPTIQIVQSRVKIQTLNIGNVIKGLYTGKDSISLSLNRILEQVWWKIVDVPLSAVVPLSVVVPLSSCVTAPFKYVNSLGRFYDGGKKEISGVVFYIGRKKKKLGFGVKRNELETIRVVERYLTRNGLVERLGREVWIEDVWVRKGVMRIECGDGRG